MSPYDAIFTPLLFDRICWFGILCILKRTVRFHFVLNGSHHFRGHTGSLNSVRPALVRPSCSHISCKLVPTMGQPVSPSLASKTGHIRPQRLHLRSPVILRASLSACGRTQRTCSSQCPWCLLTFSRTVLTPWCDPPGRGRPWGRCGNSQRLKPHRTDSLRRERAACPLR